MNWLHYLVEANVYLGVFYLCYCLFLNKETHYVLGRVYLLFSCVISFLLPVMQLGTLKPVEQITVTSVTYAPAAHNVPITQISSVQSQRHVTASDIFIYIYIVGALIALIILCYRLYRLTILMRQKSAIHGSQYWLVQLKGGNTAFSFFNYLFMGTEVPQPDTIMAHELVHIRQRHSADIIFVELLKVICWFNPIIYLLQRSLRGIHEYIADEQAAAQVDALTYCSFLLDNAYGVQGSQIAHSFFNYNLLKKRIIMLNQKRSGRLARLKYLAALPLCVGMLCASTLVFSKEYGFIDLASRSKPVPNEIAKPEIIKYFKIVDKKNNITSYSDNLSFIDKGRKQQFFANTIRPSDITYIQDATELKIEVVSVDSKTRLNKQIDASTSEKQDTTKGKKLPPPPPPPPFESVYSELIAFTGKHVRYPKAAFDRKVTGNILLTLKLNSSKKISSVKIEKGIGFGCDQEVLRVLNSYTGTINKPAGQYKLIVSYKLFTEENKPVNPPKDAASAITNGDNFIGQVEVNGFIGATLPPPPAKPIPAPNIEVIHLTPPSATPYASKKVNAANSLSVTQTAMSAFTKELARTIRYPSKARMNGISGNVMLRFSVTDNKISNVLIMSGVDEALDAEAKRALEEYQKSVGLQNGSYFVPVLYAILKDNKYLPEKKSTVRSSEVTLGPTKTLNQVVVVASNFIAN